MPPKKIKVTHKRKRSFNSCVQVDFLFFQKKHGGQLKVSLSGMLEREREDDKGTEKHASFLFHPAQKRLKTPLGTGSSIEGEYSTNTGEGVYLCSRILEGWVMGGGRRRR